MKIENRHVNYGRFDSRDLFGERAGISGMSMREMIARDQATHGLVEKQARERAGRERRAELERPLPKIDDPVTRVTVLAVFRCGDPGRMRDSIIGETISLPNSLARSLAGIGRVEILK